MTGLTLPLKPTRRTDGSKEKFLGWRLFLAQEAVQNAKISQVWPKMEISKYLFQYHFAQWRDVGLFSIPYAIVYDIPMFE